jgi:sporulation protein YlmC with PRC-barrel domain
MKEKIMSLEQLSKSVVIMLTVPALMLASSAVAAEKERGPAISAQTTSQERAMSQAQPVTNILKISDVIGQNVENPQGDNLGEINDVVVDPNDGSIVYAVLEAGGFLGLGEKFFAIPWRAFQTVADDDKDKDDKGEIDKLILNVDKDRMQNAPGFDKDNWPDMADTQWGQTIHSYYRQDDYWKERQARRQGSAMTQEMSTVSATVQQIRGDTVELQVPQGMVQDLQAGDRVEVSVQKQVENQPAPSSQSKDKDKQ